MNYVLHLLVMIGIYLPLAYSLNLLIGFGGLVLFCHAAFYGIGAYAYALLITKLGLSPLLSVPATILITALLAFPIGLISLRFRQDLFLFVTLGFQMIVYVILFNWVDLTNGPYGIAEIPRPEVFGMSIRSQSAYLGLVILMNALLLPLLFVLYRSPFGLLMKALRENEEAAESIGINANRIYLQAFVVTAAFAAVPGAFYAVYVTYIDPSSFTLKESIFLAAILLLGGAGNLKGPFVGVSVMLLLPEALRFIGMPDAIAHNMREVIYGLLLAVLMYLRPQGIAGEYKIS